MKELRIVDKSSQRGSASSAVPDVSRGSSGVTAVPSAAPTPLSPCPPPQRLGSGDGRRACGRPPAGMPQHQKSAADGRGVVRPNPSPKPKAEPASFLDEAPVEACLEYLTRPHHSWDSASKAMELRRERVAEHESSILARSFAFSRRSSMLSSFSATTDSAGLATFMNSSFASASSAASAPAGFPRTAKNGSRTQTGALRRSGRLAGPSATPAALAGSGAVHPLPPDRSTSALVLPSSSHSAASSAVPAPRRVGGGRPQPKKGGGQGKRSLSFGPPREAAAGKSAGKARGQPADPSTTLDLVVGGRQLH